MKTLVKTAAVLILLFGLAVLLFHDKRADAGDSAPRLEIYYMYGDGETQQEWFAGAIERFNALNPSLEISAAYPGRELLGKLRPRLIIGNPPDMVNQSSDELRPLLLDDLVEPLDSYLDEPGFGTDAPWRDSFFPGLLDAYSHNGHVYMIPQGIFAYVFFYNVSLFERLGLEPPATWSEFLNVCQVLKDNGIEPIASDGSVREYNCLWYPYLATRTTTAEHVLDTAREEPGTSWTEPCYIEAARALRDLRDKGYIMKGYEGSNWPSAQMRWMQGECAMLLCGTWIPKEMKAKMPDGFRMGFFPFPRFDSHPDADGSALVMEIEAFVIPKQAKNKRAAIDFLKFITTADEGRRLVDIDIVPAVRGAGMPPALAGFAQLLAPPTKICRISAGLGVYTAEWYRSCAREVWSQYFLGNYEPAEMCAMVNDATKRYYAQRAALTAGE